MEAVTTKKRLTILMAALVVVAALAAQPASAQEDRQGGEVPVRTQQSEKQVSCDPGGLVGGEFLCTSGSFTGYFPYSGTDEFGCTIEKAVEWGDGSRERMPFKGKGGEITGVPHQYKKPGTYTVSVIWIFGGPSSCEPHDPPLGFTLWTVEVPGVQKCEQGASSGMGTSSDDPCSEANCAFSLQGICLIDSDLKDSADRLNEIKEDIEKAKAITDREERAQELRKLENKLRSAREEYTKLLKEAKKEAIKNAKELGLSKDAVLKGIKDGLTGQYE